MEDNRVTIEFEPTATGGFPEEVRDMVRRALWAMRHRNVRVIIEEAHRPASSRQRRYYNGVALPAVHRHFKGHGVHTTREQTHEFLKRHVGGLIDYDAPPDSSGQYPTRSFSPDAQRPVDVREMGVFFERLWAWAAGISLYIPSPREPMDD